MRPTCKEYGKKIGEADGWLVYANYCAYGNLIIWYGPVEPAFASRFRIQTDHKGISVENFQGVIKAMWLMEEYHKNLKRLRFSVGFDLEDGDRLSEVEKAVVDALSGMQGVSVAFPDTGAT